MQFWLFTTFHKSLKQIHFLFLGSHMNKFSSKFCSVKAEMGWNRIGLYSKERMPRVLLDLNFPLSHDLYDPTVLSEIMSEIFRVC